MSWKPTSERPKPNTRILIADEQGRVFAGYMSSSVWTGHTKPTVAFHGEYYDFDKQRMSVCLLNAEAWMPLPPLPFQHPPIRDERLKSPVLYTVESHESNQGGSNGGS